GLEVLVVGSNYDDDGHVDCGAMSGGNVGVLLVKCRIQRSGPGADGGQRIRLVSTAEELWRHGDGADPTLPECQSEPGRRVCEEPQALVRVADHSVGQRGEIAVGQQTDQFWQAQ